jgi:hypothetical protein
MNSAEAAAHAEIRNLVSAYSVAGDQNKLEQLAECFTEEGVLAAPTQTLVGRAEIIRGLSDSRVKWRSAFVRHHVTTTWVQQTSESEAIGRAYFLVISENGLDRSGIYSDEYCVVGGRWLIRYRFVQLDYVTADTLLLTPPSLEVRLEQARAHAAR